MSLIQTVKTGRKSIVLHFEDAFDPSESRDPSGKWTAGGGSSRKTPEQKQTTSFVSPNEDPENLSFEQAVSGLKTKRQKLLAGISHQIDDDLGINDIRINHVVGAWADGAENSVMTNSASADPDIEEAAAAMKGYLANQKAVLLFHPDDKGHQFLAQFRVPDGDLTAIHKKLLDNGVIFHTLEPRNGDTIVHFYGDRESDLHHFADVATLFDQTIEAQRGHGKFIPPEVKEDGTDAEQRAASREGYLQAIRRVVNTGKLPDSFESKWANYISDWERQTGERIGGGQRSTDAFDPAEARDPTGKWTTGGGSSAEPEHGGTGRSESGERRGVQSERDRGLEEAQAAAERAAAGHPKLIGLPDRPIIFKNGDHYIPGPLGIAHEVAESYTKAAGIPYNPPKTHKSVDKERATRIARAFDEMKHDPSDPKVKAAYKALAKETLAQWQAIKKTGLKVEWIKPDQEDPYAESPRKAALDVQKNNHWYGFPTDQGFGTGEEAEAAMKDNPLLEMTDEVIDGHKCCVNDIFRIVHDYFGHFKEGVGFRASGEENAWRSHASMYSKEALPAVTSETRGQNSWVNYGPYGETNKTASGADTHYAPQKIGIMPAWTWQEGLEDDESATTQKSRDASFSDPTRSRCKDNTLRLGKGSPCGCSACTSSTQAQNTLDKFNPTEARDPTGKWTAGSGGSGRSAKANRRPWIEQLRQESGANRTPWIQELAEKEKNRPGVVSKAAHAAVHGAQHALGKFSEEDYEALKEHFKPRSKTRETHAKYILRVASVLPHLLKLHFKEEWHKFKHAVGALKALSTGNRPTPDQWRGLRQTAITIALTGAVFMLSGHPTGGAAAAHAVEHVAEHAAEHVVEHAVEHGGAAAAQHLIEEFGHELAIHTMAEHAAKFGAGAARMAAAALFGAGAAHLTQKEEKQTKDAEEDTGEFSSDEIKLLQDYCETLADVVATYPIPDEDLKASLSDKKTDDAYDPSESRDPDGKWTSGGNTSPKHREQHPTQHPEQHPEHYEPPEKHEPQPTPAKPSDNFKTPKKTVKAYKLFETKPDQPGKLFPLFIDSATSVPIGEWMPGRPVPTKSFAPRPGWHAGELPLAPHLRDSATHTKIAPSRVWAEVEMPDDEDWQTEADKFGRWSKGSKKSPSHWIAGDIKDRVPEGGHYKFNTKPGQGGTWLIGGAIRVKKVLSDQEVHDILMEHDKPDDAKHETNRSQPFPFKKTKDSRWRAIHVHTIDRVFNFVLGTRDAEFDPADHPTAPKGTKGKYKGGEFVPKGGKPSATPVARTSQERGVGKPPTSPTKKPRTPAKPPAPIPPTDTSKPLKGSSGHTGLISTSQPKGKYEEFSQPSFESMKNDPKRLKSNIIAFSNPYGYPLQEDELYGDDETVARHVIDHVKSNLKFIYDNTPKEQRDHTKNWYDGARKLVDQHVEKYKQYGLKDTTVAGVYACLSPNNLWDQNVRQGDQMIDIYLTKQDEPWSDKMDKVVTDKYNDALKKASTLIKGKKLKDLQDPEDKALWIRTYDQANNTTAKWNGEDLDYQPFHKITPEGERQEWYLTKKSKKPQGFGWTSLPLMAKAIAIMESNGDRDTISREMGKKHKIRSFYNNILDPNSTNDDVTMDTHAIDAAWLMDAPIAVAQNFKNVPMKKKRPQGWIAGASSSVKTGNTGTYGIYATAYRETAHELGVQPRQLQSIVWETKREWLVDIPAEYEQDISQVWDQYREGKYTIEQAQNQVKKLVDEAADKKEVKEEEIPIEEDEDDEDEEDK